MKLTRKKDPYWVERFWLEQRGILNPTSESLAAIRKWDRVALAVFIALAILFLIAYFYFVRAL